MCAGDVYTLADANSVEKDTNFTLNPLRTAVGVRSNETRSERFDSIASEKFFV